MYRSVINNPGYYWIVIPKVASNSFKRMVRAHGNCLLQLPEIKENKPVYAVIRNPRDRFASALAFAFSHRRYRITTLSGWRVIDKETPPEDVMTIIEEENDDVHFMPQSSFLPEKAKLFKLDGSAWKEFLNIDKEVTLNPTRHLKAEDWFSPELLERIDRYYATDWKLYEKAL